MPSNVDTTVPASVASLRLKEARDGSAVLAIPGTDYELHLSCATDITTPPGKRVKGEVHARALRMHKSDTGGRFIEPVYGTPRIVQGTVMHIDEPNNRVLLNLTIPAWVTIHTDNDIAEFQVGDMWNCYAESGTSFEVSG